MIESIEAGIGLIVVVTERVSVLDMVRVREALVGSQSRLVGPNSQGVISPGLAKLGVMPSHPHKKGKIGVVSRSSSLTYEAIDQLTVCRLGQSTSVGIGGDPVHGLGFGECLELFFEDPETEGVLMIGEVGGQDEEIAAATIANHPKAKPVAAYIAGRAAPNLRRMGHAGTFDVLGQGLAEEKISALRAVGVTIVSSPALMGECVYQMMRAAKRYSAA